MLVANALAVGYARRIVADGIDFTLQHGTVLALLGPNGSGKTTLLKTLLGLVPARHGTVMLDGRPLAGLRVRERARVLGYVPQVHASPFAFSVEDVVLMGRTAHAGLLARPSRRDREVVRAVIERLGIAHLAAQPVTMISGGERQLALIARALAQQPRIVMFDEPTASLDFGNQGKVMRELRRLADDGLAVLFTTHDPNQASRFADVALLLGGGSVQAIGPASEVVRRQQLQALYGTAVEELTDASGRGRAFLPG
jgi:iron complex transport system ATP-binding protein